MAGDLFVHKHVVPYRKKPIPSEWYNEDMATIYKGLSNVACMWIAKVPPDAASDGVIWWDSNYDPPVMRVYRTDPELGDLQKWEWFGICWGDTAPAYPREGAVFVCTSGEKDKLYVWNGSAWLESFSLDDIQPVIDQFNSVIATFQDTLSGWDKTFTDKMAEFQEAFNAKLAEWESDVDAALADIQLQAIIFG